MLSGKPLGLSGALLLFATLGCDSSFESPSRVTGLRVLAVRPEPASGAPGASATLELLYADPRAPEAPGAGSGSGAAGADTPAALELVWLGGCHNPATRQFYGCYPWLSALSGMLEARVLDTPVARLPPELFSAERLQRDRVSGTASFTFGVPEDILSGAHGSATDAIRFGVSYVFFALCAGELRARPDFRDRMPFECVDAASGAVLGSGDSLFGFTTFYSYDGVTNHNPELAAVRFGGVPLEFTSCQTDDDCGGFADPVRDGFDEACGLAARCVPRVVRCPAQGDCPKLLITPELDASNAEPLPGLGGSEILWADFYATYGVFDSDTQLINDRGSGWIADHGAYFHAPRAAVDRSQLWVTVHDQRGGSTWQAIELLVRDAASP